MTGGQRGELRDGEHEIDGARERATQLALTSRSRIHQISTRIALRDDVVHDGGYRETRFGHAGWDRVEGHRVQHQLGGHEPGRLRRCFGDQGSHR